MNEWHASWEVSEEPCSAFPWWPHRAYGRNLSGVCTDLPVLRGTQCLLQGLKRNGESVWTKLSFLSQTFWFLCPFHSFLGIRTTNLICWIIGFQGTCDLGCYCALLLWPQAWIGSQEAPSLARKLDGALAPRASLRLKVTQIGNAMCFFLW